MAYTMAIKTCRLVLHNYILSLQTLNAQQSHPSLKSHPVCLPWRVQMWYITCGVSLAANVAVIIIRSLLILCYKSYSYTPLSCMACAKRGVVQVSGQLQMQL